MSSALSLQLSVTEPGHGRESATQTWALKGGAGASHFTAPPHPLDISLMPGPMLGDTRSSRGEAQEDASCRKYVWIRLRRKCRTLESDTRRSHLQPWAPHSTVPVLLGPWSQKPSVSPVHIPHRVGCHGVVLMKYLSDQMKRK